MGSDDGGLAAYELVECVLLERLGSMEQGLWRVSLQFKDGTTKPEGMFTDPGMARAAAEELSNSWDRPIRETP